MEQQDIKLSAHAVEAIKRLRENRQSHKGDLLDAITEVDYNMSGGAHDTVMTELCSCARLLQYLCEEA